MSYEQLLKKYVADKETSFMFMMAKEKSVELLEELQTILDNRVVDDFLGLKNQFTNNINHMSKNIKTLSSSEYSKIEEMLKDEIERFEIFLPKLTTLDQLLKELSLFNAGEFQNISQELEFFIELCYELEYQDSSEIDEKIDYAKHYKDQIKIFALFVKCYVQNVEQGSTKEKLEQMKQVTFATLECDLNDFL